MAPRIGFTLEALRRMDSAACATDIRLVWRSGDEWNMGLLRSDGTFLQGLHFCGPREMRLLAKQLEAAADERESYSDPHEVVIP
jgi:hypothetical protein